MPIAINDQVYEDQLALQVALIPPELKRVYITKDDPEVKKPTEDGDYGMVVDPNVMMLGKEMDKIEVDPTTGLGLEVGLKVPSTDSTMPLGSPTEPTGALKQEEAGIVRPEPYGLNPPERGPGFTPERPPAKVLYKTKTGIEITDHDIEDATDLAGNFMGSMAGVKAMKGQKLRDLNTAQIMEGNGKHPDVIFKETGMFRGAEGRWRFEIDDSVAAIKPEWHSLDGAGEHFKRHGISLDTTYGPGGKNNKYSLRKWKTEEKIDPDTLPEGLKKSFNDLKEGKITRKLSEVLDHPELFKAYPELKELNIVYDPKHKSAHAAWHEKEIVVGPHFKEDVSTFLHETQHIIQDIEGFAGGGAPMKATEGYRLKFQKDVEALKPEVNALTDKAKDPKNIWTAQDVKRVKELKHITDRYLVYIKEADKQASDYYMRMAGEIESRNVEIRALMKEADRRKLSPRMTQDMDSKEAIVMPTHASTTAYGVMHPETGHIIKPK